MNYEKMNAERPIVDSCKRVGAYCRVSTDKRDQANSLESQQRFFREYIERREDWKLVEVYPDEGISGTSTKKRKNFNRMIQDAKAHKLDLIITKEVSRFARNTVDSLQITRDLKAIGVGVIFMNDNINSLDPDAELRLTIMSSIAQEESRKTSERVKWGQTRQMEKGVVFGRDMIGYDVKNGVLTINEEGARIVRKVFEMFVYEDLNIHTIGNKLREMGIKPMRVNTWSDTVLRRMLQNEKYCGDLVQKKTYTPDYLSHAKKYNRGQEEFVIIKDHHEPIVSRELFDAAQKRIEEHGKGAPVGYSNRYCFSGKIICGRCGTRYIARYRDLKGGGRSKYWACGEAHAHGNRKVYPNGETTGCSFEAIRNIDAINIMKAVFRQIEADFDETLEMICHDVQTVLNEDKPMQNVSDLEQEIEAATKKKEKLLNLYLEDGIQHDDFLKAQAEINEQIRSTQQSIDKLSRSTISKTDRNRIKDVLRDMAESEEFNDEFYRRVLSRMIVHDRTHVDVYLKMLPLETKFELESVIEKRTKKKVGGDTSKGSSDTPISVKVALTRSSGME